MSPPRRILWSQLRIGVVVTSTATILALLTFFLDQVSDALENRYTLYFYTFTTQTLRPRAPVWLAGQPVGYVAGLHFEPPTRGRGERLRVELSVKVDAQPFIQGGAVAQVITAGLLGEAVVNILPTPHPGEDPLPDGGELPTASELDPVEAARRFRALGDSLRPAADRWRAVLDRVEGGPGTLSRLARQPGDLEELERRLTGVAATFDALGSVARGFADVMTDADVRSALGRIAPRLAELAARWNRREGTLGGFLSDTVVSARLEALGHTVARLGERLESGRGTLGRLLYDRALAIELARTREMLGELRAESGAPFGAGRPGR